MGVVDSAAPRPQKGKKGGLKRPKRRISIRIDMTPMVDIAFLLLIFYMVTTVFSAPQAMEINLPPDTETRIDVGESRLLILLVDEDGTIYWKIGKEQFQTIPYDSLRGLLLEKNQEEKRLVTLIQIHKLAKYSRMVDIIDEIQMVEKYFKENVNPDFSYRFSLLPLSDRDVERLEKIKKEIGGA